mmetsp:Transcript_3593/g.10211  ORF Transcript_3593/g.10211 Transcript_3593/m.10211 type:complete len:320 (-) Transcript_3593:114-1073(-)
MSLLGVMVGMPGCDDDLGLVRQPTEDVKGPAGDMAGPMRGNAQQRRQLGNGSSCSCCSGGPTTLRTSLGGYHRQGQVQRLRILERAERPALCEQLVDVGQVEPRIPPVEALRGVVVVQRHLAHLEGGIRAVDGRYRRQVRLALATTAGSCTSTGGGGSCGGGYCCCCCPTGPPPPTEVDGQPTEARQCGVRNDNGVDVRQRRGRDLIGATFALAASATTSGGSSRRTVEEGVALVPPNIDQDADAAVLHQRGRGRNGQGGRRRIVTVRSVQGRHSEHYCCYYYSFRGSEVRNARASNRRWRGGADRRRGAAQTQKMCCG